MTGFHEICYVFKAVSKTDNFQIKKVDVFSFEPTTQIVRFWVRFRAKIRKNNVIPL